MGGFVDDLQAPAVVAFTAPAFDREHVDLFHRKGIAVWVANTNDRAVMSTMIDPGVDGIMTDSCGILAELLRSR